MSGGNCPWGVIAQDGKPRGELPGGEGSGHHKTTSRNVSIDTIVARTSENVGFVTSKWSNIILLIRFNNCIVYGDTRFNNCNV